MYEKGFPKRAPAEMYQLEGPFLFLVYINDLVHCADFAVNISLFADNVKVFSSIQTVNDNLLLQKTLDIIYNWSVTWQLPISVFKCYAMSFGRNATTFNYILNNSHLEFVPSTSDLGVFVQIFYLMTMLLKLLLVQSKNVI